MPRPAVCLLAMLVLCAGAQAAPAPETGLATAGAEPAKAASQPLREGEVYRDPALLPPAVAETRRALIEAAETGNVENLRPIFEAASHPVMVSFGLVEDPIEHLKVASGDGRGLESLAIMLEILDMGFAVLDPGSENETWVWPYFFAVPLDRLDDSQLVELYQLLPPRDVEEMKSFGGYMFYRLGIAANGEVVFFVAGD